jgi:hypothetical protein
MPANFDIPPNYTAGADVKSAITKASGSEKM